MKNFDAEHFIAAMVGAGEEFCCVDAGGIACPADRLCGLGLASLAWTLRFALGSRTEVLIPPVEPPRFEIGIGPTFLAR